MKKIVSVLCVAALVCALAGIAVGCGGKAAALVDWSDRTETVSYGSVYRLRASVSDTAGKEYAVTAAVAANGAAVETANGEFRVTEKNGYTVRYTCEAVNSSVTVTLAVTDSDKPVILFSGMRPFGVAGARFDLPAITAEDEYDGDGLVPDYFVEDAAGTKLEIRRDGETEYVIPPRAGQYFIRASVADSAGNSAAESASFEAVELAEDEWNCLTSESASRETQTFSSEFAKDYRWYDAKLGKEGVISYTLKGSGSADYRDYFSVKPILPEIGRYENAKYLILTLYFEGKEGAVQQFQLGGNGYGELPFGTIHYNQWYDYYLRVSDGFLANFSIYQEGTNFARLFGRLSDDVTLYVDGYRFTNEELSDATPVAETEIVFVNGMGSLSGIYHTGDVAYEYVPNAALPSAGGYPGNAVCFLPKPAAYNNNGYRVKPRITRERFEAAVAEAGYTKLYLWTLITSDAGTVVLNGEGILAANETYSGAAFGVWRKVLVPITPEMTDKLFADGGAVLFGVYQEGAENLRVYVGDLGFDTETAVAPLPDVVPGEIAFIGGKRAEELVFNSNPDIPNAYVPAEELADFAGGYTGGAIQFTPKAAAYNNATYLVMPRVTREEFTAAVAEVGYTNLYLWTLVTSDAGTVVLNGEGLFAANEIYSAAAFGVWRRVLIPITPELVDKLFTDGGARLFGVYQEGAENMRVYVGDFGFDAGTAVAPLPAPAADEISFALGERSLEYVFNSSADIPNAYVPAEEIANFTGNYAGNAVRFTPKAGAYNNATYLVRPRVTREQFAASVQENGYNAMYVWVCATADESYVALTTGGILPEQLVFSGTVGSWKKVTVSLTEELVGKLFAETGALLFGTYQEAATNMQVYVGDIGLCKV